MSNTNTTLLVTVTMTEWYWNLLNHKLCTLTLKQLQQNDATCKKKKKLLQFRMTQLPDNINVEIWYCQCYCYYSVSTVTLSLICSILSLNCCNMSFREAWKLDWQHFVAKKSAQILNNTILMRRYAIWYCQCEYCHTFSFTDTILSLNCCEISLRKAWGLDWEGFVA